MLIDPSTPIPASLAATGEAHSSLRQIADAMPQLIWSTNAQGQVDYVNRRWTEYTGLMLEGMDTAAWPDVLHPDDVAQARALWEQAVQSGGDYEVEYRLRSQAGAYRWFLTRGLPLRDDAGRITGWLGTCTDIEDQKRAERDAEARAEREAVLNRISLAIRSTLDSDVIQATVCRLLGEGLNADRCCISLYDTDGAVETIVGEWRRSGLPPLADGGPLRLSTRREALYAQGRPLVLTDTEATPLPDELRDAAPVVGERAVISVPLFQRNQLLAALTVTVATAPRHWTEEEVLLVETTASLARAAVEVARVHQRERHIAETLQGALKPVLPDAVPGLDLHAFYQPALDEASVGGDFYDVFPIEKNCWALVVGDLSGKGLAAAAQIATVRHMLRFAVFSTMTIAEAVTRLNHILTANSLLSGFATLSVAAFDFGLRNLTYVSCGHEPALLRRTADGQVQELPPTGPALGVSETSRFREEVVPLVPGDSFAFYTDGLTEAGPTRLDLLGVEGLAALMRERAESAAQFVERMIAGAEAHAHGAFHDDVCLLVGMVKANGVKKPA